MIPKRNLQDAIKAFTDWDFAAIEHALETDAANLHKSSTKALNDKLRALESLTKLLSRSKHLKG